MTEKIRQLKGIVEALGINLDVLLADDLPEVARKDAQWAVWECLGSLNRGWAAMAREEEKV